MQIALDIETQKYLASLHGKCEQIEFEAKRDNDGEFSRDQKIEYAATMALIKNIYEQVKPMTTTTAVVSGRRTAPDSSGPLGEGMAFGTAPREIGNVTTTTAGRWQNLATGEEVRVFGPRDSMQTNTTSDEPVLLGRFVRGLITGNWKGADREKFLALSEGGAGGGQFLVPEELSTQWLDLARAQSVLIRAGMPTVQMQSESMNIARVDTDPTFTMTGENVAIADSDILVGNVMLVARKLGTLITVSREVAEDAPNAAELVQNVLARSLAVAIDRLCLIGNAGSDGVDGLVTGPRTGMGSTGSVGAIAWEDFHNAAVGVRESNYVPNAIVVHPTILGDAQILASGDGTNSAKLWLGPPPSLNGVEFLPTTSITTAYAAAGDFTKCLFGARTGMTLETSNVAANAFEKHQIKVKVTQRFSFVVPQPSAFYVLSGITT